jgi:hypothetical protein
MSSPDDDLDWLDALAGRTAPDAEPVTLMEAGLLRQATRAWPTPRVDEARAADLETLLSQARAEGLLRKPWCSDCDARWRALGSAWRRRPLLGTGLGLGVAGLLLVLVPGVLAPPAGVVPDAGTVLRGADAIRLLRDADPAARRDRIAVELEAGGATVSRYERLGRFGLDASGLASAPNALRERLAREGLQPEPDGTLRVEIESARP